jgi:poly-gamma-glutamate capsule biosynthesis protein CapA/YwtB (metallophosphatase superfamily)
VDRRQIRGIDIVNLAPPTGASEASRLQVSRMVSEVARADNLVIVLFHWEREYTSVPMPHQRTLGRAAIDAGADLVIGCHSHVLQGIEAYAGRHIVYSSGNFVFDGNRQPEVRDTIIHQ